MTIEQDVAALTTATTALLTAVNVSKTTLDTKVADATAQVPMATAQVALAADQVALATTQKTLATTQAINAATSATTATTQAGIATTQAAAATAAAVGASNIVLGVSTLYPAIRPSLDLDFANSQTVDPRITFTRASTATRTNARGLIEAVASGVPRLDFDPVTGACKGLLIEEQRANQLLNSTIDGANLATQSVTVLAVQQTLSFYGTGTITLSGVYAGTLVGSGVYPARSTLTLTPTAGTLTFTVTGTVQYANFEIGASNSAAPFPTTYIPTVASQVTRAADVASMTGANFSSWYRQDEGSFVAIASAALDSSTSLFPTHLSVNDGTLSNRIVLGQRTIDDTAIGTIVNGGATQVDFSATSSAVYGTQNNIALAYKVNDAAIARSGVLSQTDASLTVPTVNQMGIGVNAGTSALNGHIRSISYYPKRLTNAELQALSTQ